MTLDDERLPVHVAEAVLRDRPLRRAAVNYVDERDRALEVKAEAIVIARDHVAQLEAEYAAILTADVDFDPDPGFREPVGIDARLFDLGIDRGEEHRPIAPVPRSVSNVDTGGRT